MSDWRNAIHYMRFCYQKAAVHVLAAMCKMLVIFRETRSNIQRRFRFYSRSCWTLSSPHQTPLIESVVCSVEGTYFFTVTHNDLLNLQSQG